MFLRSLVFIFLFFSQLAFASGKAPKQVYVPPGSCPLLGCPENPFKNVGYPLPGYPFLEIHTAALYSHATHGIHHDSKRTPEKEQLTLVEKARRDEADRVERERLARIRQQEEECRSDFTSFRTRTDHDEASVSLFFANRERGFLQNPELLNIGLEHFRVETREVYKTIIGGIIYITHPSNTEVSAWLRDTAGLTADQFVELDRIRSQNTVRLRGGEENSSLVCAMESIGELVSSMAQMEQCEAFRSFVTRQVSRM